MVLNFTGLSGRAGGCLRHLARTLQPRRAWPAATTFRRGTTWTNALNALSEYHQSCRNDDRFQDALVFPMPDVSFDGTYRQVIALTSVAMERVAALRGTGIYNNQLELEKATKSFNDVVTKHFCVEIKTRVDEGVRTLRQMNNELRNLSFGQDSYTIEYSQWEPELRDYLVFSRQWPSSPNPQRTSTYLVTTSCPRGMSTFATDSLAYYLLKTRSVRKGAVRIADYRNYRRYDIICESPNGGRVRLST